MDGHPVTDPADSTERGNNNLYPSLPIAKNVESGGVTLRGASRGPAGGSLPPAPPRQTMDMSSADEGSVQAQLDLLWKQREELLSINNKWAAQYEVMTRYYKGKVREQRPSAKPSGGEEQRGQEEKHGNENTSEDKVMSRTDAEQLRTHNAHLARREQHQGEEIRRLNQALEEALESCGASREDPQDNVWKHQAEVYKEDFLKERRDRERLKTKLLEMEVKYRKTHGELHKLKSKITWTPVITAPPPAAACNCTNAAPAPASSNYDITHRPHNAHQCHHQYPDQSGS
ncbi:unnamed protein product [Merluccius merluccius]